MLDNIVNYINHLMWDSILIYLLLGVGVYFTVRLGLIQIRHFGHAIYIMRYSRNTHKKSISSFQAWATSVAARVGTGNLAGVAIAVTVGGPGAVFWMWVTAILGMATSFAESTLAQVYKVRDSDGNFRGGPAYYIEQGLGCRWLGILFAIFLIINFGFVFNALQGNTIVAAMQEAFNIKMEITATILVAAVAAVIFTGLRGIARFAELVVPVMALLYVTLAVVIVIFNITQLPAIIMLIVKSAFGWQEVAGGAFGVMIMTGIKRGLFSNEAGMGSAPNAAATALPMPKHPVSQGYVQMLGVFVDTIVICTATAAIILLSGDYQSVAGIGGIQITQQAMNHHAGSWGAGLVAVALLFFAFTTIVANYSYAETNLIFLKYKNKIILTVFRVAALAMIWLGSLRESALIWNMADTTLSFIAVINLIAILLLSNEVVKLTKDYSQQLKQGKLPVFDRTSFPELDRKIAPEIWNKET